jgi:hypothetical protein
MRTRDITLAEENAMFASKYIIEWLAIEERHILRAVLVLALT